MITCKDAVKLYSSAGATNNDLNKLAQPALIAAFSNAVSKLHVELVYKL